MTPLHFTVMVIVMRTYGRFHLYFNAPLLALLGWLSDPAPWFTEAWFAMALVLMIVMVFTTPWDNYAVLRGIWDFPKGRYAFRIGKLPVEEYLFFIIQSLQVMMLVSLLVAASSPRESITVDWQPGTPALTVALLVLLAGWLAVGWKGRKIDANSRFHYCWHLFYWFAPVIVGQWALAWPVLVPRADIVLGATLVIGTYLSLADWVAIRAGLWFFDQKQITGHKIGGRMPWEEAAFFYVTSLVVAQSYLMFLPEALR